MRNARRLSQDETNVAEVVNHLCALIRSRSEFEWYALVDTVFDYPDGKFLNEWVDAVNCYTGDPQLDALAPAAPCLMPLRDSEGLAYRLTSLLRHCSGRPMISFFACEASCATLVERWRAFYMARLDDGQDMLLRFADTRVLPNLPHVLTNDQWGSFCCEITHWYYIDRNGEIIECMVSSLPDSAYDQLRLSSRQVDRLIRLSYPDILMGRIVESLPEAIPPSLRLSFLYELTATSYRLAQDYFIENEADVFSLAVAACLTGGKSNDNVGLHRLLEREGWVVGNLGDEIVSAGII